MTTTDIRPNGPPALEIERMSDNQLRQRIELNRAARFGLQDANPAQLNVIFVLSRRWQLDPVTDLTLYQGHPWITADGWARIVRRQPEWTTYAQHPLSKDEKRDWGYNIDDIVVATDLGTKSHGVITGYGKVTKAEIDEARDQASRNGKRAAPIGLHPVEMAQKRSLARTARLAFGQDVPDETVIEQEMTEEMEKRTDPVRNKELAAKYVQIYGSEDMAPPDELKDALARNANLLTTAVELSIPGLKSLKADSSWSLEKVEAANDELANRIRERNNDIDEQLVGQQEMPTT